MHDVANDAFVIWTTVNCIDSGNFIYAKFRSLITRKIYLHEPI